METIEKLNSRILDIIKVAITITITLSLVFIFIKLGDIKELIEDNIILCGDKILIANK